MPLPKRFFSYVQETLFETAKWIVLKKTQCKLHAYHQKTRGPSFRQTPSKYRLKHLRQRQQIARLNDQE